MNVKYLKPRVGNEADLRPEKMVAGEIAVASDTKKVFIATKNGSDVTFDPNMDVKQLADEGELTTIRSSLAAISQNQSAIDTDIAALRQQLVLAQSTAEQKFGYAEVGEADKCLYIFDRIGGKLLAGPLGPFAGEGGGSGGGGGGGSASNMEISNTSGWATKSISQEANCPLSFSWSSTKDEFSTGDGTLLIYVNGAAKSAPRGVAQGENTVDVKSYLSPGTNSIRVQVTDVYGTIRYLVFTVTVVAISLTSSFDSNVAQTGGFNFPYTPYGNVTKTMHFALDGTELDTEVVELSGRQMFKAIPAQTHGTHSIEVWFVADVDGVDIESNHIAFEFMSIAGGDTNPIISSAYTGGSATQWDTAAIAYQVYDPLNAMAAVTLSVNGEPVSQITVDRTEQTWAYRFRETGQFTLTIACRTTSRDFVVNVSESSVDIQPVTEGLALYLTAQGRSNGEAHPETWGYEDISATLSNFNFRSDGWQLDSNNNTVLRVSGDDRVTIPYKMFQSDKRVSGFTAEFEFATKRVRNYDAPVITCWQGSTGSERGVRITAQEARMRSSQKLVSMQYKEDEHVRIAFVVTPRSEGGMMYIYVNGVLSQAVQYPSNDDFSQLSPVNISIGSNDCTTDIYCIRVYNIALTSQQIIENWIADTQDADLMLARFDHNNVFDIYGNIVISKLPQDLPYMVLQTAGTHLPQFKGDKVTLLGYYTDPLHPDKSFAFSGAQFDVQGTSSQFYKRKNYKGKFKAGFTIGGQVYGQYALSEDSIATNEFCFKADVASSEGANNVIGVKMYNNNNPYKTPAQLANSKVRQGIEGYPMLIFEDDGEEIVFIGKYNFNHDKGTPEVFGLGNDESVEFLNNTSDRCNFKSDDFTGNGFLSDFEWSNPEDYNNPAQMQEFFSWVVSCDPDRATGDALDSSVTYGGTTYSTDTADYRIAKFKAEASNYMMVNQALYYYLFTELMLMVDSRAKNMFLTFWGEEVA